MPHLKIAAQLMIDLTESVRHYRVVHIHAISQTVQRTAFVFSFPTGIDAHAKFAILGIR